MDVKLNLWIVFELRKQLTLCLFLLFSEFDLAAVVLFVGDVYLSGQQKRQWVFIVDGSGSKSEFRTETGEICSCILAVSFFSPVMEDDCSFELFSKTLEGSTVVFSLYPLKMLIILHNWCNLIFGPSCFCNETKAFKEHLLNGFGPLALKSPERKYMTGNADNFSSKRVHLRDLTNFNVCCFELLSITSLLCFEILYYLSIIQLHIILFWELSPCSGEVLVYCIIMLET